MMRMPSSETFKLCRGFLDFGAVAEHDGRAEPQRVKLPRRLQNARLRAFGKHDPFGMPLQFFNDIADETHAGLSNRPPPKLQLETASRPRTVFAKSRSALFDGIFWLPLVGRIPDF